MMKLIELCLWESVPSIEWSSLAARAAGRITPVIPGTVTSCLSRITGERQECRILGHSYLATMLDSQPKEDAFSKSNREYDFCCG
jgi:hypothetical protein